MFPPSIIPNAIEKIKIINPVEEIRNKWNTFKLFAYKKKLNPVTGVFNVII